jgi:hypothetical protein
MTHSKIRRALLAVLLLAGCGGERPSDFELTVKGTAVGRPLEINGGWALDGADRMGYSEFAGAYGPTLVLMGHQSFQRISLMIGSGGSLLTNGPSFTGLLDVDNWKFSIPMVIERVHFVSSGPSVLEYEGTLGGPEPIQGDKPGDSLTAKGTVKMYSNCATGDGTSSHFDWCGTSTSYNGNAQGSSNEQPFAGEFAAQLKDTCPTEVSKVFIDGNKFDYRVSSLRVGAAKELRCHVLAGGRYLCEGTATQVQAAGCTWTVDAVTSPIDRFIVLGVADSSCQRTEGRFCRAGFW